MLGSRQVLERTFDPLDTLIPLWGKIRKDGFASAPRIKKQVHDVRIACTCFSFCWIVVCSERKAARFLLQILCLREGDFFSLAVYDAGFSTLRFSGFVRVLPLPSPCRLAIGLAFRSRSS